MTNDFKLSNGVATKALGLGQLWTRTQSKLLNWETCENGLQRAEASSKCGDGKTKQVSGKRKRETEGEKKETNQCLRYPFALAKSLFAAFRFPVDPLNAFLGAFCLQCEGEACEFCGALEQGMLFGSSGFGLRTSLVEVSILWRTLGVVKLARWDRLALDGKAGVRIVAAHFTFGFLSSRQ